MIQYYLQKQIYGQHWGSSYSKSAKYSCTRCDQIKDNSWIVVLMTIWTLISMSFAIKGDIEVLQHKVAINAIQKNIRRKATSVQTTSRSRTISFNKQLTQNNIPQQQQSSNSEDEKSGIYIKMFTNYLQIVGSIATFNLSIPSGIFEFPQSIGQPLKQTMNSLDCVLQDFGTTIPIIYLRLIFSLFIPVIYMLLFLIGIVTYALAKRQKKFPWYILSTATMFLIIYVQPDLVAQIIALMSCRTVGDTSYILSNVSFECYTDQHIFYTLVLIGPLLLVWVFILPIILFIMLRKNKERLDTIEIKLKYGFLYKEYKHYSFYWEFVKMAEKIAIILSLNFYSQSIVIKAVLVFIIIMLYGILSLILEPYQEKDINQVDVNSTNVCALTVLLGLFIYNNPFSYFVYVSLGLIVLINVLFIVRMFKKIIGGYIPIIQESVQSVFVRLSKKVSCFEKCIKKKKAQKTIKPEIKERVQNAFKRYLEMKPNQKRNLLLKVIESQLAMTHGHLFKEQETAGTEKEITKEIYNSSENLKVKLTPPYSKENVNLTENQNFLQTPKTLLLSPLNNTIEANLNFFSNQDIPPSIQISQQPSYLNLKDVIEKKNNNDLLLLDLDSNALSTPNQTPNKTPKLLYNNVIQEDQIDIDFHESQNDIEN